jgi:hypothetical protein
MYGKDYSFTETHVEVHVHVYISFYDSYYYILNTNICI